MHTSRPAQDRSSELEELDEIASLARPLGRPADFDPLMERIGDARYVLLGEASHGTADFYSWRAALTRRLIAERGFSFVAVEGDWPDCLEVDHWVRGRAQPDRSAREVLAGFERWPTWMWANDEVAGFVEWLREHNRATGSEVGFYGLDVYSLWESLRRVFEYLRAERPEALPDAERALRCFEPYGEDPERYARATRLVPTACEQEVVDLLRTMHRVARDGASSSDFEALQDAWVVEGAERYYRAMVRADNESWNVRDCHMVETLDRLVAHHGGGKAVVWEHNTHVGDARATDMARAGMVNVGQVVRERHDDEGVVIVGFSGHHGHVIAAQSWGAPTRQLPVPRAPAGTHEDLLAQVAPDPSLLVFPDERDSAWLGSSRGHRAIGVVYRPERDAFGNWVPTVMGRRYDALCSFGTTHALHPLAGSEHATGGEAETYPWAV